MDFIGTAIPLDDNDIISEAQKLGCEPAAILAVCDVESAGSGFLPDKRPKILFEAHYFHILTSGRYDRSYPNISSPRWDRVLYGASGAHQYERLDQAIYLNRFAGLESASWGKFQIMGANYAVCGYTNIELYVQDMMDDEANHLHAFGNFCVSGGIVHFLVNHDWAHFALRYNGTGNVANYAEKLSAAYQRHSNLPPISLPQLGSHSPAIMILQIKLIKLGYLVVADGYFGFRTETAVRDIQKKFKLNVDGIVGTITEDVIDIAIQNIP